MGAGNQLVDVFCQSCLAPQRILQLAPHEIRHGLRSPCQLAKQLMDVVMQTIQQLTVNRLSVGTQTALQGVEAVCNRRAARTEK